MTRPNTMFGTAERDPWWVGDEAPPIAAPIERDPVRCPLNGDVHPDKPLASEPTTASAPAPGLEGHQGGHEWKDGRERPALASSSGLELETDRLREVLTEALDLLDAVEEAKDKGRIALRLATGNLVRALRAYDPRAKASHLQETVERMFHKGGDRG